MNGNTIPIRDVNKHLLLSQDLKLLLYEDLNGFKVHGYVMFTVEHSRLRFVTKYAQMIPGLLSASPNRRGRG